VRNASVSGAWPDMDRMTTCMTYEFWYNVEEQCQVDWKHLSHDNANDSE
jgi:hypothetical protein